MNRWKTVTVLFFRWRRIDEIGYFQWMELIIEWTVSLETESSNAFVKTHGGRSRRMPHPHAVKPPLRLTPKKQTAYFLLVRTQVRVWGGQSCVWGSYDSTRGWPELRQLSHTLRQKRSRDQRLNWTTLVRCEIYGFRWHPKQAFSWIDEKMLLHY